MFVISTHPKMSCFNYLGVRSFYWFIGVKLGPIATTHKTGVPNFPPHKFCVKNNLKPNDNICNYRICFPFRNKYS